MKRKLYIGICILVVLIIILGCVSIYYKGKNNTNIEDNSDASSSNNLNTSDNVIILEDNNITSNVSGVSINNNVVTITNAGKYEFSGTLSDGSIVVDASKDDDVTIVLNNVDITCKTSSAIYSKKSNKTVIELIGENSLKDTSNYEYESKKDEEPNSTIFSKDDLLITGDGTLNLSSNFLNSIFSKDGLTIENGNINIQSSGHGIKGKDYVYVKGGNIDITSSGDGIKSTNEEDNEGYIVIEDGNITINSTQDGISSKSYIKINGGTFNITTGGGSSNVSTSSSWMNFGKSVSSEDEVSAKAIKAETDISILGGNFKIDSADDSIHSNNNVTIEKGEIQISSGDDGIHADSLVNIKDGTINILQSYEGIEGENITIDGGDISVVSSDDGINVSGGNDMSSQGGRPGENNFSNNTNKDYLTINGGNIYVNASGDGLDSNGSIIMTGGTVNVDGPTDNSNGALDYDGTFEMKGGTLIAVGSSGMAQAISESSSVNCIYVNYTSTQSANTKITLKDSNQNEVISYTPTKSYSNAVICTEKIKKSNSYYVYSNDTKVYDVTVSDVISYLGNSSGFGGMKQGPRR